MSSSRKYGQLNVSLPSSRASSTTNLLSPSPIGAHFKNHEPATGAALAGRLRDPNLRSQISNSSLKETRPPGSHSVPLSISDKFSLSPDPTSWGADLSLVTVDADDYLHNPDPRRDRVLDRGGTIFTARGLANVGCLSLICIILVSVFAGLPVISHFTHTSLSSLGGFNVGGINASGQVPSMPGNWGLIDKDTPQSVYQKPSYNDGRTLELVFSDEFNQDGRSFYPGDDPYWEAVDLHYWQTGNMEWDDPAAVTTKDGYLEITLSEVQTHNLSYQGGMVNTWNKFCFTGGLLEANVSLPGPNNVAGLWPAVWAMGNLGRAGYGASLDGTWPYSYDTCDVGTVANQSVNGIPIAATENGDPSVGGVLSFLPGQRLSRCTCAGESHPGPFHEDGTYVGRSAPEIDVFEGQMRGDVGALFGEVSQSGQWAPFNAQYAWFNTSDNLIIADPSVSEFNTYVGGAFQQATSVASKTDPNCYEMSGGCFSVYGFEYKPGFDGAYISWISSGVLAWTLNQAGMGPDSAVEIGSRPVPQEPMYIIANLGMSTGFGPVDLTNLVFPTTMRIDYIRVYQRVGEKNIGCDPPDFPTQAYINEYAEAYTNPLLTTWVDDYKQPIPKNSFLGQC